MKKAREPKEKILLVAEEVFAEYGFTGATTQMIAKQAGVNKAMIHYTQQEVKCRMQVLQEYFGEKVYKSCEKCDVCLDKRKPSLSENYSKTHTIILKELSKSSFKPDEIPSRFKNSDIKGIKETIKLMLDSGELYYDQTGFIRITDIR